MRHLKPLSILTILAGALAVLMGYALPARASNHITPNCTIALPGAPILRSAPLAVDLNGDGRKEIVVGGSDGMLYAVKSDCSGILWQKQLADYINPHAPNPSGQDIESSPAAADIDGDGHPEIVVSTGFMPENHHNGAVLVLDHNGNLQPGWPKLARDLNGAGDPPWNPDGYSDGFFSTPALGDIDGDQQMEIVVGSFDKCIYAWEANGSPVAGWWDHAANQPARCLIDTIWSSPALADLDGDGVLDIIIGTDAHPDYIGGSIWALKGDNTVLWTVYTTQVLQSSPAVGDINNDGFPEVVIGTGTYYQGEDSDGHKVYAFDRFGNHLPGWPVATQGDMPSSPALADLDGDGFLEVVIGCGAESDVGNSNACAGKSLYVLRHNGQAFPGYPTSVTAAVPWEPRFTGAVAVPPIVADIHGDGKAEILAVVAGAWGVTAFSYDQPSAPTLYTPADAGGNTLHSSPLVTQLTDGGPLSMVTAGRLNNHGAVFIWTLQKSSAKLPWPMFRRDAQRTGAFEGAPNLSVAPSKLFVMHQQGESGSEQVSLWIRNRGGGSLDWSVTAQSDSITISPASGTTQGSALVTVTVSPGDRAPGKHNLGNIVVRAESGGKAVDGSPVTIPVTLIVGDIRELFLPVTQR